VAAHRDQQRHDGTPYIAHPLSVCELLARHGAPEPVLVAALLHDAVEDSEVTVGEVVERFGVAVGELVAALTEDEGIDDWVARKDALRAQVAGAGAPAASIYAADKVTNLREMRGTYAAHGEAAIDLHKAPTLDLRVAAWRADLELVERLAEPGLAAELRAELQGFEQQRMQEMVAAQEAGSRG
ncbi:MAG: HD domain-containing protein, partial [Vicinamibacteria bacterium]|jgi:(p)ppGpp synthase/HD superfamily hydrolase